MISMASTRKVQTKGRINVRYSHCWLIATPKATVDSKNRIQYKRVGLFEVVMLEKVSAKIARNSYYSHNL